MRKYESTSNVYLPRHDRTADDTSKALAAVNDLYNRPQFIGQFWMGVVVWPAVWHIPSDHGKQDRTSSSGHFMRTPDMEDLNAIHTGRRQVDRAGLGLTVIAGVLNILVIYDALAGPAFTGRADACPQPKPSPEMINHNVYLFDLPADRAGQPGLQWHPLRRVGEILREAGRWICAWQCFWRDRKSCCSS